MNTDVIERPDVPDEAATTPADPVEAFLTQATMPPRELISKEEMGELRTAAMEVLEKRYGEFTPDMAMNIANPVHRFMVLGDMASTAWTKSARMDKQRANRRTAIQILRFNFGWKPMAIVRHMEGDTGDGPVNQAPDGQPEKRTDRRVVDFAIMAADKTTLPKNWTEERAMRVAYEAHQAYTMAEKYGEQSRPLRDALLHELAEGCWLEENGTWQRLSVEETRTRRMENRPAGRIWTNAELSRLGKMSTAMVAQIRTGVTPAAKRAAAAA